MKKLYPFVLTFVSLLFFSKVNFGQAPTLGGASGFAVFSSAGAFANVGPTSVTGDVGNNAGAFAAFPPGTLNGQIHTIDGASGQAATDLATANTFLLGTTCGTTIAPAFGNGQVIPPGVYCQTAVATLTGSLTLDAQGDKDAVFIIKLDATLTSAASSEIILINSASLCNVYWHVAGAVVLGVNSSFGGTIISNGAITLHDGVTLSGRALTTAGAISLNNNIITIASKPTASVISASGATIFCAGNSVTLSGNVGGIWSSTESVPAITVNTSGDYFVTNANAFCSTTSNHINVTVNPLPLATTGSNTSICNGNNLTLGTASIAGHSYSWTPATGLSSAIIANPIANPTVTTTYTLTETITATGCEKTNSVIVTVDNLLTASTISANGPTTFCGDDNVILSGSTGGTWSNSLSTSSISVNTGGDYFVTNTNACNTVTSNHIIVTVNPQAAAQTGNDISICKGNSVTLGAASIAGHSYYWTPTTGLSAATIANPVASPTSTAVYSLTETIIATGCNKTNAVAVTVNELPLATTGSDATICNSIALGTASIAGHTYSWTPTLGLSSTTIANPIASPSATTTYTLTETITATGCQKTNSVVITVNELPLAATGSDVTFCNGNNVTLGASSIPGNTYLWTPATGLNSAVMANPIANPSITTVYTLTETITLTGCQQAHSVTITVNQLPLATTGNNVTICNGNSITLGSTSISGHTYSWAPIVGLSSASMSDPIASPLETTTFTLTENITATGCEQINWVTVTVDPIPTAAAGSNAAICNGNSVTLGAAAIVGNTYSWTPTTGLSLATVSNPVASPSSTTAYAVTETITSTGCFLINYVDVTVNPLPLAVTGSNTAICSGSSVTLGAATISGNTYSWIPIAGLSSETNAEPFASPIETTTYTLTETVTSTGCEQTNSVTVTVNPLPAATTINNVGICSGDNVAIGGASTSGSTYSWTPITELNSTTISNPVASPSVTRIYTLTETDILTGCQNSNSISVLVDEAPAIITQPANQTAIIGNPAFFSIEVMGTELTYQWRKGVVNLIDGGNISGVTTDTLTINSMNVSDTSSNYNVVISGICFLSTVSQDASLLFNMPTGIVSSALESAGEVVSFYPNPFTTSINVVINDPSQNKAELKVFNILGVEVLNTTLIQQVNTIETGNLSSGIYIYKVISNNKTVQTGRLISQQ